MSKTLIVPLFCLYPGDFFYIIQRVSHTFFYVNMFSSSGDTRKLYFSGEKVNFDQFINFFYYDYVTI